jgi:hypothetical protein
MVGRYGKMFSLAAIGLLLTLAKVPSTLQSHAD